MTRRERDLRKLAERFPGFVLERHRDGKGHFRLRHESGAFVVCTASPSDPNNFWAIRNSMRRILRQAGRAA